MSEENTKEGRLLKEAWYSDKDSINRHVDLHPAQLALRKWDSNRQRNRHKWPDQCPYNYDCEVTSAPSHEQGHEICTNSQRAKDTLILWDQHQRHSCKQREHLLPSGSHPLMRVPPQCPHDGLLPLERDNNHGELGEINKRRLRSAAAEYGDDDHKKGGEKETKRNEGTTRRTAYTLREREMTCRLDLLPTMRTIISDFPPPGTSTPKLLRMAGMTSCYQERWRQGEGRRQEEEGGICTWGLGDAKFIRVLPARTHGVGGREMEKRLGRRKRRGTREQHRGLLAL